MEKRPDFETLASYEEFKKYYWYRKELSGICRRLGIEYRGTKQELNHLMSYNTDFSDKIIMAIVLVGAPLLIWFMGYYLFINGVKLEIYENNIVKYYTYGSRGRSVLHFKFKLEDIEQIKFKKRPFNCLKLTIKVRNPVFYGFHEKKLNKLMSVNIIADRKESEFFMQQMEQFQRQQRRMIER